MKTLIYHILRFFHLVPRRALPLSGLEGAFRDELNRQLLLMGCEGKRGWHGVTVIMQDPDGTYPGMELEYFLTTDGRRAQGMTTASPSDPGLLFHIVRGRVNLGIVIPHECLHGILTSLGGLRGHPQAWSMGGKPWTPKQVLGAAGEQGWRD